ncbi:hypothetical protein [Candidatus Palauibacter sp.]|uniref:hypothetical protein n=1 Tax=Candidatus Palauibacter sp. TaxID=3101350 RepID=UPI003B593A95
MSETTVISDDRAFGVLRRSDALRLLLGAIAAVMFLGGFSLGAVAVLPAVLLLAASAGWLALHSP